MDKRDGMPRADLQLSCRVASSALRAVRVAGTLRKSYALRHEAIIQPDPNEKSIAHPVYMKPLGCIGYIYIYIYIHLENPLMHKKVLRTVFGIRALLSAPIQFEHFLRLPSCFGEVLERNEPATRAHFPASWAPFSATRAHLQQVYKAKDLPRNPCVCMCGHLFARKARASICVSMGPAGIYVYVGGFNYLWFPLTTHQKWGTFTTDTIYIYIYIYI